MCSCGVLEGIQVMQQLGSNGGICAHGKGELPLWPCQATGVLDEFASQGAELFERPQRRPFFGGVSDRVGTEHLQFPVEIVRHYGREHEGLIAGAGAGGNLMGLTFRWRKHSPSCRFSSMRENRAW